MHAVTVIMTYIYMYHIVRHLMSMCHHGVLPSLLGPTACVLLTCTAADDSPEAVCDRRLCGIPSGVHSWPELSVHAPADGCIAGSAGVGCTCGTALDSQHREGVVGGGAAPTSLVELSWGNRAVASPGCMHRPSRYSSAKR